MIKSDGNGSFVVPKWFFVVLTLIIALITTTVTVAGFGMSLRDDVDYLQSENQEAKETVDDLEDKIGDIENHNSRSEAELLSIKEDVSEIKADVKLLLTK